MCISPSLSLLVYLIVSLSSFFLSACFFLACRVCLSAFILYFSCYIILASGERRSIVNICFVCMSIYLGCINVFVCALDWKQKGRTMMKNVVVNKQLHHYIMHAINPIMAIYNISQINETVVWSLFGKRALSIYDLIQAFNIC